MDYLFGSIIGTLANPFVFWGLILIFAIHSFYKGRKSLVKLLIIETVIYFIITEFIFKYDNPSLWMSLYLLVLGIYLLTTGEKSLKVVGGLIFSLFIIGFILFGLLGSAIVGGF